MRFFPVLVASCPLVVSPSSQLAHYFSVTSLSLACAGHHVLKPLEGAKHAGGRVFDRSENGRYVWLYQGSQVRALTEYWRALTEY